MLLRPPNESDEKEALIAHLEFAEEGWDFLLDYESGMSWREYLSILSKNTQSESTQIEFIPSTFLFAVVNGEIVGRVSIRHELNARLYQVGGHIGYGVRPQFRGKGYATQILRYSKEFATKLGLSKVLLTCSDDNLGSTKAIESEGGILVSKIDWRGEKKRRYWILLDELGDQNVITLSEYNENWPKWFNEISEFIKPALNSVNTEIVHIGSTSIPGAIAKPIIDIDVVVSDYSLIGPARQALEGLGYISEGDLGVEEREAFRPLPQLPNHHLYLLHSSSKPYLEHMKFRQTLLGNKELLREYCSLKKSAEFLLRIDRGEYTNRKTSFIQHALYGRSL